MIRLRPRGNSTLDRYNNLEPTTYRYGAVLGKSDFHVDISKYPRGEFEIFHVDIRERMESDEFPRKDM